MATFVAFLGLGLGCSTDDIKGNATAQGVEAGLNSVLSSTVEPLVVFLGEVPSIVGGGVTARSSFGGGLTCPDTSSVCDTGSVSCTVSGSDLSFQFTSCVVVTGDAPITLNGNMLVTPGVPIALSLTGLVINGSPAMTGTGSVNVGTCTYVIDISTDDSAFVEGTIVKCDPADNYPKPASHLTVSIDDVQIEITFDGSAVAHATATKSGDLVANCDINLAADPFSSSCSAP